MSKLGDEDPNEKMDYLHEKMQVIRVTGSIQKLKKPNKAEPDAGKEDAQSDVLA